MVNNKKSRSLQNNMNAQIKTQCQVCSFTLLLSVCDEVTFPSSPPEDPVGAGMSKASAGSSGPQVRDDSLMAVNGHLSLQVQKLGGGGVLTSE